MRLHASRTWPAQHYATFRTVARGVQRGSMHPSIASPTASSGEPSKVLQVREKSLVDAACEVEGWSLAFCTNTKLRRGQRMAWLREVQGQWAKKCPMPPDISGRQLNVAVGGLCRKSCRNSYSPDHWGVGKHTFCTRVPVLRVPPTRYGWGNCACRVDIPRYGEQHRRPRQGHPNWKDAAAYGINRPGPQL